MIISKRTKNGRTTGVYGHLPKFVNLRKLYRFDNVPNATNNPYWDMYSDEEKREIQDEHWGNTIDARMAMFPWRVSYVGYLRLVTKKAHYTFWYMGNPYRHKIFERFKYSKLTMKVLEGK